ncbi:hypothetical protein [Rahnella inusitata]|uniref:hypothetical protein n=1 Tax=Rahnella inusitata TaxID=58169 RepID=UPI0039AFC90C
MEPVEMVVTAVMAGTTATVATMAITTVMVTEVMMAAVAGPMTETETGAAEEAVAIMVAMVAMAETKVI